MSTTKVTLKINSYQTKNTISSTDNVFAGTSKAQNCTTRSILDCVHDFFSAAQTEVNDNFSLHVCGNLFEQAFVQAEGSLRSSVLSCTTSCPEITWPTRDRLLCLQQAFGDKLDDLTIPVSFAGNVLISLPEYPLVKFVPSPSAPRLVVSNDWYQITDLLEDVECENIVFHVGGENRCMRSNGPLIIGCTAEEVQSLVCSYLETRYINPFIGQLCQLHSQKITREQTPVPYMCDKLESVFYADYPSKKMELFVGEEASLGLHSIVMGSDNQFRVDDVADLRKLSIRNPQAVKPEDNVIEAISFVNDDPRLVCAQKAGVCTFAFYTEGACLMTVEVRVSTHIYVARLMSEIINKDWPCTQWELGKTYTIRTESWPAHAEDVKQITVTTDHPEIAQIRGNKVTILQEGTFTLITKSPHAYSERAYVIKDAYIRSLRLTHWPSNGKWEKGKKFNTDVFTTPALLNHKGVSVRVLKGEKRVQVDMDENGHTATVQALKRGACTVEFVSNDNPEVTLVKDLTINPPKGEVVAITLITLLCALIMMFWLTFSCIMLVGWYMDTYGPTEPTSSTAPTNPTAPTPVKMIGSAILSEMKSSAEADIFDSTYSDKLLGEKKDWSVLEAEYIGYFLFDDTSFYYTLVVYEATLCHPETSPVDIFVAVASKANGNEKDGITKYLGNNEIRLFSTVYESYQWGRSRAFWSAVEVCETDLPYSELYALFGWDAYVDTSADICDEDASALVQQGYEKLSSGWGDLKFEDAYLYLPKDIYEQNRNELYIYFSRVLDYDNGTSVTYYHSVRCENIKVITNEDGEVSLDWDSVSMTEEDYVLSLPYDEGYIWLDWDELAPTE